MGKKCTHIIVAMALALGLAPVSASALTIPGADGSDGAFVFVADGGTGNTMTIDLSLAAAGPGIQWDTPSPVPGRGVYDPDKWAVVFKYTSVTIPAGKTVVFQNNAAYAPVVWLVSGNVSILGTVNLSGAVQTGGLLTAAEPGPGGFRGGRGAGPGLEGSAGHGPGGANYLTTGFARGSGGSYASLPTSGSLLGPVYGNNMILPLIGGSGGSASRNDLSNGGGAGGGAITIASTDTIGIWGAIYANGGGGVFGGGGSGGAVRCVAQRLEGSGVAQAVGGAAALSPGGSGRIRFEANEFSAPPPGTAPQASVTAPGNPILIWPPADAPSLRVTQITPMGGSAINAPADPRPAGGIPDVVLNTNQPVIVSIAATNVPLDWPVIIRVVPHGGASFSVNAAPLAGTLAASTTSAQVTLPPGTCSIQLRAVRP